MTMRKAFVYFLVLVTVVAIVGLSWGPPPRPALGTSLEGSGEGGVQVVEWNRPLVNYAQLVSLWREGIKALEPEPVEVRGIYLTAYTAGRPDLFEPLLRLVEETELNAMVIDAKNDSGVVTYRSEVPAVVEVGGWKEGISDIRGLLKVLSDKDIYSIARIVAFKDPVWGEKRPDLAVQHKSGGVWRDRTGAAWLNPYKKENWDYVISIAQEAARQGFREIQFDYVRFPSDGNLKAIVYPGQDERSKAQVIAEFLTYARKQLKPYRVFVSADIFGLTTTYTDDMGIGQHLETLAPAVDYLSPMVYPSHYSTGNYGLRDPDASPYETVFRAMTDARERLDGKHTVIIRPWLQDFSLRNKYGAKEVAAQIRAARDAGMKEWLLWNPSNRYTVGALKRETSK
jgi:hypothetical protein